MRVLVVGAGRAGTRVIRQLQKNPNITVITVDPREQPYAVEAGFIEKVDVQEVVTPLTLEYILEQVHPDLVLLAAATEDLALGHAPGLDLLSDALREELASISDIPVIPVARTGV